MNETVVHVSDSGKKNHPQKGLLISKSVNVARRANFGI